MSNLDNALLDRINQLELDLIETKVAREFILSANLRVIRNDEGVPVVNVDKILVDPPKRRSRTRNAS